MRVCIVGDLRFLCGFLYLLREKPVLEKSLEKGQVCLTNSATGIPSELKTYDIFVITWSIVVTKLLNEETLKILKEDVEIIWVRDPLPSNEYYTKVTLVKTLREAVDRVGEILSEKEGG
ncbi:hypothetical protein ACFL13_02175 [Patescibacteria group bacterium]